MQLSTIDLDHYRSTIYHGELIGKKIQFLFPTTDPEHSRFNQEWFTGKLSSLDLQLGDRPRFSGVLAVALKSPEAIIKFFKKEGNIPKWIFRVFNLKPMPLETYFKIEKNEFSFENMLLQSASVKVGGFLNKAANNQVGAFLIQSQFPSVGISLDKADYHFHFFPSKDWLSFYPSQGAKVP